MPDTADVVILCGGAGLRLRQVTGDGPKAMASLNGRPFLELLLRQVQRYGFPRVILAIGYRGDAIRAHFGMRPFGLDVVYSPETVPLGTGGALRNAAAAVGTEVVLVMNGDSYTDVDLTQFAAAHRSGRADVSVVAVPVDGRADCGSLLLDADGNVLEFKEKEAGAAARYLNAGVYLISQKMLSSIPAGVDISLERSLFPRWLAEGSRVKAFVHRGRCVDIGTPGRYLAAQEQLAGAEENAESVGKANQQ
jgi:NDP-sugar pyrophosphorylase family protein